MKLSKVALSALCLLAATATLLPAQQGKKSEASTLDWNQFRGPNRDGISADTGLLKDWPGSGPAQVWKASNIGVGYSSVCISGNKVFTMGESGGKTHLIALNVADGKPLWQLEVGEAGDPGNQGAGPRSTPATDGTLVFGLSQKGELVCAQAAKGQLVWKNTMEKFGGRTPGWGWSESPLLDGAQLVISPGSSNAAVVALNKMNGATLWQAKVKGEAHYTSLAIADIGGLRQYLYFNNQSVAGIVSKTGALAWSVDRSGQTAIASTPVYKDGIVFVSSGYGVGHNAFRVQGAGGRFQAQEIYKGKELENHHGGMVVVGDHVYGCNNQALVCVELKTGKVAWQDRCVGKGSVIVADGNLIVRGEGGGVALVEANPAAYKEHGKFNLPKSGGNGAWANPVVYGGHLYLREWDNLYCYDLKGK